MLQTRDETGQDNAGLWLLNTFHTFMFALIIFWSTLLSFLRIQKLLRQLQKFLVMLGFTGWLWCLIFWKFYKAEFPQRFNGLSIRTLLLRVLYSIRSKFLPFLKICAERREYALVRSPFICLSICCRRYGGFLCLHTAIWLEKGPQYARFHLNRCCYVEYLKLDPIWKGAQHTIWELVVKPVLTR